jgi:hypothetical protein
MMFPPFQKPIEIAAPPAGDWIIQPKLDGVAAAYSSGKLWSRTGKIFPSASFAHILKDLRQFNANGILYGELWHPDLTLQEINGLCNHHRISTDPVPLMFVIYDYFNPADPTAGYTRRMEWADHVAKLEHVKLIGNLPSCHLEAFDGTIYRAPRGIFIAGRPTPNIRKLKNRAEMDATVTGAEQGARGSKLEGMISALNCLTPAGVPFSVYSGLTFDHSTWYKERLPSKVKIKYQRLSDAGAPLSPVFLEEIE